MNAFTRRDFLAFSGSLFMGTVLPTSIHAAQSTDILSRAILNDGQKPIRKVSIGLDGGRIFCLSNRSYSQMFGIVMVSPSGRVSVIDGGFFADGKNLFRILESVGSCVDYWFLTHAHCDHYGALTTILEKSVSRLSVQNLCMAFPSTDWIDRIEPDERSNNQRFAKALSMHPEIAHISPYEGQSFDLGDDWKITALNNPNLDLVHPNVNDTGVCFSLRTKNLSWLVTGDIGVETGNKLVKKLGTRLEHEYVFMAHHGQNGADKSFYAAVKPRAAIWPTPTWLWENDAGQGPGSGIYNTNYTKCWMQELGVKLNYVLTEDVLFV